MGQAAVRVEKLQIVEELKERLLRSRIVGLARITGIPAPQMQSIRERLRGKVEIRVVKNRLLLRALEAAAQKRKGIESLEELVDGQVALVMSDMNPFKLFRELEATKTKAPARGGEPAPEDIVVKEGDTPFKPGPVVGELQRVGIPAAIERGKVVIKKDKLLVERGQAIPRDVAQVLTRLGVFPITVGLDLAGVYEDGSVLTRDVLAVDGKAIRRDVALAAQRAMGLSMGIAFPTSLTAAPLLAEAHRRAIAVALASEFPEREVLPQLLARAQARLLSLARQVPGALSEDLKSLVGSPAKEAPAEEEPSQEEKKEDEEDEAAAGLSSLFG